MDMTMANAATSGAGLLAGAERTTRTVFDALRAGWADYRAYHATLAELRGLTDKQLSDAGFRRDALERIALEAVYGR
jgi:uncharacterized protein YjiS (DUF1127 family)